jgi:hypothetical protein
MDSVVSGRLMREVSSFGSLLTRIERQRAVVDGRLIRAARWRGCLARELDGTRDRLARRAVGAAFDRLARLGTEGPVPDVAWLLALHGAVAGGGRFRTTDVQVGDATSTALPCAPWRSVAALSDAALARCAGSSEPPPVRAARLHLDMIRAHPFDDGNGRVARLAAAAVLLRAGYRSTLFTAVEQHARDGLAWHGACRRLSETGDEDAWITFALEQMAARSEAAAWRCDHAGARGDQRAVVCPARDVLSEQTRRLAAETREDRGRRALWARSRR